jgi:hypothetical protein
VNLHRILTTPDAERDAQDWLTGPVDAATQAWIDESVAQYDEHRRQVEAACTGLQIGTATYGRRQR